MLNNDSTTAVGLNAEDTAGVDSADCNLEIELLFSVDTVEDVVFGVTPDGLR